MSQDLLKGRAENWPKPWIEGKRSFPRGVLGSGDKPGAYRFAWIDDCFRPTGNLQVLRSKNGGETAKRPDRATCWVRHRTLFMHPTLVVQLLVLVAVANATPIFAKKVLGETFAWPLDGGAVFIDGGPLLGASKTIRGVVASFVATSIAAALMGLGWELGALAAGAAMAGDILSSFVKRRLGLPPSSMAFGLDQIPESLFPFIAARWFLPVTLVDMAAGTVIFLVCEIAVSRILFKLHMRDEPY